MALTDLIQDLIKKHGNKFYLLIIIALLIFWGTAHYITQPGDKVSILGIIEYNKKPEEPTPVPEMIAELEALLSYVESSHIHLLRFVMKNHKNKVNMFMNNEWIPIFSSEFFSNPKITSTWDIIVRENNKSDRQAFLNLLGSKLLIAANKKQDELTIPLSELEEKSVQNIMNYYKRMHSVLNDIVKNQLTAKQYIDYRMYFLNFTTMGKIGFKNDLEGLEKANENMDRIGILIDDLLNNKGSNAVKNFHKQLQEMESDLAK